MRTFLLCFFLFFCSASSSHFLGECNRRWVRSCSRFFSHHNWITVLVAFELLELISTNKEKHEWRRITTEAMKLHFIISEIWNILDVQLFAGSIQILTAAVPRFLHTWDCSILPCYVMICYTLCDARNEIRISNFWQVTMIHVHRTISVMKVMYVKCKLYTI